MIITKTSQFTGKENSMDLNITEEQLNRIKFGKECIQYIVPHLTADEREFLLSGCTPKEWDEFMGFTDL